MNYENLLIHMAVLNVLTFDGLDTLLSIMNSCLHYHLDFLQPNFPAKVRQCQS